MITKNQITTFLMNNSIINKNIIWPKGYQLLNNYYKNS